MKKIMLVLKNRLKLLKVFQNRKLFLMAPLLVVLIALVCGTIFQLSPNYDKFANVGVDFQGGTLLNVEMVSNDASKSVDMNTTNREYNLELIEKVLETYGFTIATSQASGDSALVVRYSYVAYGNDPSRGAINYGSDELTGTMKNINDEIMADIETTFKGDEKYKDNDIKLTITASLIGTSASIKLLKTAFIAISIALAVMFLYIIIRFDIFSALSSIVALLHDVVMMMAFMVIFRVEMGSTIVAAIITIVAYSINNTIVVFDRLRENVLPYKQSNKRYDVPLIVNDSILSTFTRTIYTTLTTLITITILAIMGVSAIRIFALPIIFGLLSGFYSSAFLVAPFWGMLVTMDDNRKKRLSNPNSQERLKKARPARKTKNA